MKLPTKAILIAALVLVYATCVWILFQREKARVAATHSTLASLYAAIQHTAIQDATGLLATAKIKWEVLEDAEYDRTISVLSRRVSLDAGRNLWTTDGVLIDSWKNRLLIAIRRSEKGDLECIVWSKGMDGLSGTSDDVIVPHGVQPP